ncbi:hypothetical protein [Rhodoblastus sp.]|uniref:hypothetical protein n=1 Tax=Rhodoblastus sp. TaxID=1962975 RepID=UPI003F9B0E4C
MPSTHDPHSGEFIKDYPKQVFPHPPERPPEYLAYLERATLALSTLRLVVYAGLAGFVLLAAYGFFLIYLLTGDAATMAKQTQRMTAQMEVMTEEMRIVNVTIGAMQGDIGGMRANIQDMNRHIASMDTTTQQMSTGVALMQHSVRNLDASVGPAMGAMNHMVPFGAGGNSWPGAGPFMPVP